jgi:hypothetical protein
MSTQNTLLDRDEEPMSPALPAAYSNKTKSLDLHQALPPIFAGRMDGFLQGGVRPLATVWVAGDDNLGKHTPARALVLTEDGVLFMEEGETVLLDKRWGVKSLLYPYSQITAVGTGAALLTGRFTLHGTGNAPPCEITLQWDDLDRFDAVAKLIGEKIASA